MILSNHIRRDLDDGAMGSNWEVRFSKKASKQYENLKRNGVRPSITDAIDFLAIDLTKRGPERNDWPNYGKLSEKKYHCHLRKGKTTFVACWSVIDKEKKRIEIYYVGTHEGAPY